MGTDKYIALAITYFGSYYIYRRRNDLQALVSVLSCGALKRSM